MHKFELQLDLSKPSFSVISQFPIPQSKIPFDFRNILWHRSFELLKHLAANGMILRKGIPLIVDLFSPVSFFYEVAKENGALHLSGKIAIKKDISLKDCDFIAPCNPPWFIVNNQLKVIKTEIGWLELQKLPRIIDSKELEELIEESKQKDAPKVKLLFEGSFKIDPTPLLQLTDRKGAFANLLMKYGERIFPYNQNDKLEAYWEKDLLETGFIKKIVDQSHYYCPLDKVGKSLAFLLELGWEIQDYRMNKVILESARSMHCKEEKENLILTGELKFDAFRADLKEVLGAFNRREQFIDLGSGFSGLLDSNDSFAELAEEIEITSFVTKLNKSRIGLLDVSSTQWERPSSSFPSCPPSPLFKGTLRPYQQEGLNWLLNLHQSSLNGILADEMGLGKTVQIIAFFSLLELSSKILVVVPTSLLFNWEKELKTFLPTFSCYRHHGPNRNQNLPISGIVLTTYHTLQNDIDLFRNEYWNAIILDEAQTVKNPDSQISRSLYMLKSDFRMAMTGTIIENHSKELWAHFHFLMPGMLGDRSYFEKQLSIATVDSRYVNKIKKMIHPFILRRKKEEVVKDLPPLTEYTVFVEMPPSQRNIYDRFLAATKKGILKKVKIEGINKHRMEIFEAILRLRQIACSPLLVSSIFPEATEESGKLQTLLLDLETILEEGKKALIFSQFASMIHLIAKQLQNKKINYCLLEGKTQDRETQVTKFQEDPSVPFFLLTLKAGGTGLNLTAADYVLLYDPWWHDAIDAQAISRAHRIGQSKPVIAKRYITTESLEEKILTLKSAKSALFSNLLEDIPVELTDTDLSDLLD